MITISRPIERKAALGKGEKTKAITDALLLAVCVLMVLAFAYGTFRLQTGGISMQEKRQLAEMPKLRGKTITKFPKQFEAYASDRMAFRTDLIRLRNVLKYRLFEVSGSASVLVGHNNWLYFLGDGSLPVFRHEKRFSNAELMHWMNVLRQRTKWCEQHGIRYVVLGAPDKPSVYGEFLPAGYTPIRPQSRLQQLADYVRFDKTIHFINAEDVLKTAKQKGILYFKTDTHWNYRGAFLAYRRLADELHRLFPEVKPLSEQDVDLEPVKFLSGDCLALMGLEGTDSEQVPGVKRSGSLHCDPHLSLHIWDVPTEQLKGPAVKSKLRALVFHDSFGEALKPFLSQNFESIKWVRQDDLGCDPDAIAAYKPDVVIQEIVERHIAQFSPYYMDDWRQWLRNAIAQNGGGKREFLTVMPSTPEINARRLGLIANGQNWDVRVTTCREWSDIGDRVSFEPQKALYSGWYLIKSGDQGFRFADDDSKTAYAETLDFVMNSGKFAKVAELKLLDGECLALYKQRW